MVKTLHVPLDDVVYDTLSTRKGKDSWAVFLKNVSNNRAEENSELQDEVTRLEELLKTETELKEKWKTMALRSTKVTS